jgi:hypothetical protein
MKGSAKAAPAFSGTLYGCSVSSQQKMDNAKMAKKLLAVFAVCCLSAVFVSAKSTRNSDLPDTSDPNWNPQHCCQVKKQFQAQWPSKTSPKLAQNILTNYYKMVHFKTC